MVQGSKFKKGGFRLRTYQILITTLMAFSASLTFAQGADLSDSTGEQIIARCDKITNARRTRVVPPVNEAHFVVTSDRQGHHAVHEVAFPTLEIQSLRAILDDHGRMPLISASCLGNGSCMLQKGLLRIQELSHVDRQVTLTTMSYSLIDDALFVKMERLNFGMWWPIASFSASCVPVKN